MHFRPIMMLALLCMTTSARAQQIRRVTDFVDTFVGAPIVDDSGRYVAAGWSGDPDGTNPTLSTRFLLWDLQLDETRVIDPAIGLPLGKRYDFTSDGQWIVMASPLDPLGTNTDGSWEIFRVATQGSTIEQITNFAAPFGTIDFVDAGDSGTRIAFGGAIDLLGVNPSLSGQIYVVGWSGTPLLGTTNALSGSLLDMTIDDAGERIVFVHDGDLGLGVPVSSASYRILWNRAQFAQLSATDAEVTISGDGQTILRANRIVTDWDQTQSVTLPTFGRSGTLSDDGLFAFHLDSEVVRRRTDGGGTPTVLTSSDRFTVRSELVVSGDGSFVGLLIRHGSVDGVDNADGSEELVTVDTTTALATALTENSVETYLIEPDISAEGTRAIVSGLDRNNLFIVEPDGFGVRQLFSGFFLESPTLTADGEVAVFRTYDDLDEPPECPSGFNFLFRVDADGSNLTQVNPEIVCGEGGSLAYPDVAEDGSNVVYQSAEVGVVPLAGGPLLDITDDANGLRKWTRISGNGAWAVYTNGALNPGQVFRVPTDGSLAALQLGNDPAFGSSYPSVSFDGSRVVYQSNGDPLGTNTDHNTEIFLSDIGAGTLSQLTDTAAGENIQPMISSNGAWLWFGSSADFFGETGGGTAIYRMQIATGTIERTLGAAATTVVVNSTRYRPSFSVSSDGQRGAIVSERDLVGDGGAGRELYFVEFDLGGSSLRVDDPNATTLVWQSDPRYLTYDVIRGELGALAPGVDLGAVLCLEEDSTDLSTAGFEDSATPVAGTGFFYLSRGRAGPAVPSSSWGMGSGGSDRSAASGGCLD